MQATIRVNLHCHSDCSDGGLPPEALAQRLAEDGVAFAALTDHDTVDGLARFKRALNRRGIGTVSGVEVTAVWRGEEVHLLVYGFDVAHPEWQEALRGLRQARDTATQSVAGQLRQVGAGVAAARPGCLAGVCGPLPAERAIALAHRAGGRVFLAHPYYLRQEREALRRLLAELRGGGLDGVEALYAPAPPEAREMLVGLASELGLLVSAGTDYHVSEDGRANGLGVEMPNELWRPLRDALRLEAPTSSARAAAAYSHARRRRRPFGRHVVVPSALAIVLFVATIWALLIPSFERALLDRKREMIRELTHAAWCILEDAERQVQAGRISREEAQAEARERVRALRYGHDNKDYFWIQDMQPRMIEHPYRPELEGHDLSDYRDPQGSYIFVEFAEVVRRRQEGYVDYVWQWPDDPRRMEPKESYVKGFAPWGWVIGTGLYIEDVKHEIGRLEQGLVQASLLITGLVSLLLVYVVRHSRRIDVERAEAVEELHTTTERYRSLVEAATEGTLLVTDGRCRYANPHLLELLGYSAAELELLGLPEVLPPGEANAAVWQRIEALTDKGGGASHETLEGELRMRDGTRTACVLAVGRISFGGRLGLVLMVREAGVMLERAAARLAGDGLLDAAAAHAPTGLFRAAADRPCTILAANDIASRCLRAAAGGVGEGERPLSLAEAFRDRAAFEAFAARLTSDGKADGRLASGQGATFAVRATLERDSAGQPVAVNGLVEDITSQVRREQERDAVIERLQSSQLFLHEPVRSVVKKGVFCPGEMPIRKVAALLSEKGVTAALVRDSMGAVIGLATVHDLSERVLAAGLDAREPVRRVMSAPVATVSGSTPVYAALLRMQERGLHHLAVTDEGGEIVGTLCDRDLLPLQQYGAGSLTSEIAQAAVVEDVVRSCRRTAATVKALLDSGAHPRNVTRLVSSVCDAATERFVQLAVEELGPPPARFAFVALGSQGRQEQTLVTDQDNAIIYVPPEPKAGAPDAAVYFQELGRRVCGWLNEAGYPFCRGRFMAQNPVWTRPLEAWKTHFSYWAMRAEPKELLIFALFFDFRAVCGDAAVVEELRRHVFAALRESPAFFPHFARDALNFKAPVMLLGRILIGGARNAPDTLDLKAATMPVVAFARLYALRHDIAQTGTLDRLDALAEGGWITPASRDEITVTYAVLTRLRLQRQVQCAHEGLAPDNLVELRALGYTDRTLLRQAFAHIRVLQRRIAYDFLGGTQG